MRCADLTMIVCVKLRLVPGQSEIAQFDRPIVIDQHVLTLEITMEKLATMQVEKCYDDLFRDFSYARVVQNKLTLVKQVKKTSLADKLSDHIEE